MLQPPPTAMAFSKRGPRIQLFRCYIHRLTLADAHAKWVRFREQIYGWAVALPVTSKTPQVPKSREIRDGKYGSKTAICQHAAIFSQGKRQHARVSRLTGEPIFNQDMKQISRATYAGEAPPVGAGSEPFTFSRFHAVAVATGLLATTVCFFGFRPRS